MKKLLLLLAVVLLPACSTIIEGRTQEISVATTPEKASCEFIREGQSLGNIDETPGSLIIKKNKHDITIECSKSGYEKTVYMNKSDYAGASFGNILAGGIIGVGVDAATGAQNKYETPVNITLQKK